MVVVCQVDLDPVLVRVVGEGAQAGVAPQLALCRVVLGQ